MDIPIGEGRLHHWLEGELLDPKRLSTSVLDEFRADYTASAFSAQMLQQPIPQDGDLIKADWIRRYSKRPELGSMLITQSWDTAIKGNPKSDYSACTTWGELNGDHYLLHVYRKKADITQVIEDAWQLYTQFRPTFVLVEDQGSGQSLISFLRQRFDIVCTPQRSRDDKETRLSRAAPLFEKGQVVLPHDAPWLAELERELLGFPNVGNDDQVDSISQYLNWAHIRANGTFSADFGWMNEDPAPETLGDILAGYAGL
jgi:predicted phage terminase large subunit-like protein